MVRYGMQQPDLIKLMAQMIERVYPEAYRCLYQEHVKSERNKLFHQYLITEHFIRCNFGSNDTLSYDIDGGRMNLERVSCPMRGICRHENVVCNPRIASPFFPKEEVVAKIFARGYVASEIAKILGKSKNTIQAQLRNMTHRLGLKTSRDIIKVVHQLNL